MVVRVVFTVAVVVDSANKRSYLCHDQTQRNESKLLYLRRQF